MPIYDYKCNCGKLVKDRLAKWDEKVKCECGQVMQRLLSAPKAGNMDKYGRSK